jgi:methionyl-tRNA synthetase
MTEKLVTLCRQFFGDKKIDVEKSGKTAMNAFLTGSNAALILGLKQSKTDDEKSITVVDLNTQAIPDKALYFVRSKTPEDITSNNFHEHVT